VLDKEISAIQDKVLFMGSLADSAVARSITALEVWNIDLARQVLEDEVHVNQHRYEVERMAMRSIATQQPNGIDLRILVSFMNIAADLERIGDHASDIAKIIIRREGEVPLKPLLNIPEMSAI
jgi:phosphate transport system protein